MDGLAGGPSSSLSRVDNDVVPQRASINETFLFVVNSANVRTALLLLIYALKKRDLELYQLALYSLTPEVPIYGASSIYKHLHGRA